MNAQLLVLSGARTGLALPLSRERLVIGRHPDCDLQFDPAENPDVSRHHALIAGDGERWFVRDLASKHGTFLNGRQVAGNRDLKDGDRLRFGARGPVVEFRIRGETAGTITEAHDLAPTRIGSITQERLATRQSRPRAGSQARALPIVALVLGVGLTAVAGGFLVDQRRQRAAWEDERVRMQGRIDSIHAASDSMAQARENGIGGSAAAPLPRSREQGGEAGAPLPRAASPGPAADVPVHSQPASPPQAPDRQQAAAALDLQAIQRANRPAVAMLYVETEEGEVFTATAFAVRADATLLTSRHVVAGADGRQRVRRMAIQFSGSEQVWPARLLTVSNEWDLALVKVDNILGEVPTIRSLNLRPDTLGRGSPVALIGFAQGGDVSSPPGFERGRLVWPLVGTGVVQAISAGQIEVQGYGAAGASGSPIFDASGEVIAILFGGRPAASGQRVFGVPATAAAELLRRLR